MLNEEQIREAFQQIKGSPADKAITQLLEQAVEVSLATAISTGKPDSERAYDCGWAASIYSFAEQINRYRR
tara:strand:- start:3616 stop:3828 length:213 start_codon:yes stop_codon:yes gene_type:complete